LTSSNIDAMFKRILNIILIYFPSWEKKTAEEGTAEIWWRFAPRHTMARRRK